MKTKEFVLGSKLRDIVTGFEGIATARVEYLNGCVQYCLVPKIGENGKMPVGEYVDVSQLECVDDVLKMANMNTDVGGPQRYCPKQ